MVGKGSGLSLLVACCIWNSVAVELAMVVIASMHAFPQTMVQPGLPHSWQSRLDLVLHILASGLGEAGQGTLQSDLVAIGGLYQLSPAAPSGSLTGGSLRMQIPSFSGRVLGRTSSLYLSSSRGNHQELCRGEGIPVVYVLLGDVVVKPVLAYVGPRWSCNEADYAPILDSATHGGGLDDVVDSRSRETPVAELECWNPSGAAEAALDRADPTQALLWGAGPTALP